MNFRNLLVIHSIPLEMLKDSDVEIQDIKNKLAFLDEKINVNKIYQTIFKTARVGRLKELARENAKQKIVESENNPPYEK